MSCIYYVGPNRDNPRLPNHVPQRPPSKPHPKTEAASLHRLRPRQAQAPRQPNSTTKLHPKLETRLARTLPAPRRSLETSPRLELVKGREQTARSRSRKVKEVESMRGQIKKHRIIDRVDEAAHPIRLKAVRSVQPNSNKIQKKPSTGSAQANGQTPAELSSKQPLDQTDSLLGFREAYRLQPERRLFYCPKCLMLLPSIEIKVHHSECLPPTSPSQLRQNWARLVQLLQSAHQRSPSAGLFRLVDLMEWYMSRWDQPKPDNHILYSDELNRILALKPAIHIPFLHTSDLFDVIQVLGDRIESSGSEGDSSLAIWDICS